MCKRIFILLMFLALVRTSISAAQTSAADDHLEVIKTEITDRMAENRRLQEENVRLQREYNQLKISYERRILILQALSDEERGKIISFEHELDTRQDVGKSLQDMEADLAVKATQMAHLKGLLSDLEQQERLWKLKSADVEYQKQTLELELVLKQHREEQATGVYLAKIEELNRVILANRIEEKELLTQYSLLEDEANILARQKEIFDKENAYLQKESGEYQELRDQTANEEDKAQQERLSRQQQWTQALEEKQQQKEQLRQELQALQEQHQTLDGQLNETLKELEERGRLIAEILHLKENNDRLQSAIAGLQSQGEQAAP